MRPAVEGRLIAKVDEAALLLGLPLGLAAVREVEVADLGHEGVLLDGVLGMESWAHGEAMFSTFDVREHGDPYFGEDSANTGSLSKSQFVISL